VAKVIEKDGNRIIVVEKEVSFKELDKRFEMLKNQLSNIDRNIKGLQQRREKIMFELKNLTDIKDLIEKEAESIDPALPEPQLSSVE
jgi:chaperonin cofactor prefoldin